MTDQQPSAETARAKPKRRGRRPRLHRRHPVASVVTAALVVVALLTAAAVTVAYRQNDANLAANALHLSFPSDYHHPKHSYVDGPHQPLNILVMGSDTRDCKGCHIDNETGGGSDTTLLIHLSADRKSAYGISVPRDTMVDRPECTAKDGSDLPAATYQQWNAAFSIGGPSCTIEQFERLSHIPVDDSVVVDFAGFKDMVDAIGGVRVCIPQEIDDREHGIVLPQGTHTLTGNEALSYVRERHDVGDGSDLSRIKRQQAFIASMVNAVFSAKTLSNPFRVYKFLKAATAALQVDDNIDNLHALADLAYDFRDIGLSKIKFLTIPVETDPQNVDRVIESPDAAKVWHLIKHDQTLPGSLTSTAIKPTEAPGSTSHHQKNTQKQDEQNQELEQAGLCTSS